MALRTVRFSAGALAEYRSIFRESTRLFGEKQAEQYALKIDTALESIAGNPVIGFSRDTLALGLRRFRVGSHHIYYVVDSEEIRVIHIYHQRQSEYLGDWETEL